MITGEQIRTRRLARAIAFAMCVESSSPNPGVNHARTFRSSMRTGFGGTRPLSSTAPFDQSSSKFSTYRAASTGDLTVATTFSWRVNESSVQFIEPVQTDSPSRTTYLWCIRSGTPAIAFAGTSNDAISCASGSGGGGTGIGFRWSTLKRKRTATPRATAAWIAAREPLRVRRPDVQVVVREVERPTRAGEELLDPAEHLFARLPTVGQSADLDGLGVRRGACVCPHRRNPQPVRGFCDLRRRRLAEYLESRGGARLLLVGEAAGYRGARVSGLPFTSERQLTGTGPTEISATIVHRTLDELGIAQDVLLWNLVPTHPHAAGRPESNRRPTRAEIEAGLPFVRRLAEGRRVLGVGRLADRRSGRRTSAIRPMAAQPAFVRR